MNNMTKAKARDTYTEEISTPGGIRQGYSQSLNGQNYRGSIITKYDPSRPSEGPKKPDQHGLPCRAA